MSGVASKNWISGLIFYYINNEFPFLIFRSIIVVIQRSVFYSLRYMYIRRFLTIRVWGIGGRLEVASSEIQRV